MLHTNKKLVLSITKQLGLINYYDAFYKSAIAFSADSNKSDVFCGIIQDVYEESLFIKDRLPYNRGELHSYELKSLYEDRIAVFDSREHKLAELDLDVLYHKSEERQFGGQLYGFKLHLLKTKGNSRVNTRVNKIHKIELGKEITPDTFNLVGLNTDEDKNIAQQQLNDITEKTRELLKKQDCFVMAEAFFSVAYVYTHDFMYVIYTKGNADAHIATMCLQNICYKARNLDKSDHNAFIDGVIKAIPSLSCIIGWGKK